MLTPRPHQQAAKAAITKALESNDRVLVTMACGTGKTLVQTMLLDQRFNAPIVVFAPTLLLINQLVNTYIAETNIDKDNFVIVCSDKSTGQLDDINIQELESESLVFVAKNEIKLQEFLSTTDGQAVVFCTYHSAELLNNIQFSLGIFDEAHKTVGRAGRLFSYALSDDNIKIAKRVFMTATKKVVDHKTLDVYSMSDVAVYGKNAYDLSFRRAIDSNLILNYKILITLITKADFNHAALNDKDISHHANAIALNKSIKKYDMDKIISFHKTIKNAKDFAGIADSYLDSYCVTHISSKQSKAERNESMSDFRTSNQALITNSRCLTEGIDVPAVDAVLYADNRDSVIDIVQSAGRAMRKHGDKDTGYVIIPIYLESFANHNFIESVRDANFDLVWTTLQALSEVDEALDIQMKNIQNDLGRKKDFSNLADFIDVNADFEFDKNELLDAISIEAANIFVESFEYRIGQLQAYVAKHGHGFIPNKYEENTSLGYWAHWMRESYRYKKLPLYKINKLKESGFVFNKNDFDWHNRFKEYEYFVLNNPGAEFADYPKRIRQWLSEQTERKTNGKLSDDRFKKLTSIGFKYKSRNDLWMDNLNNLKKDLAKETSLSDITKKHTSYEWLRGQRRRWDKLSEDKKDKLKALGWDDYLENLGRWK